MSDIVTYLFKTNAIRFCEENKPFWYTSGKIGPYYINTHFLYGSEKEANDLLNFIDACLSDKVSLPSKIFPVILEQYNNNTIFKYVIDSLKEHIEQNIDISEIDYISGGERRDWFFSIMMSYFLGKPHISIFKDLSTVVSDSNFKNSEWISELKDKKVLHVADLVYIASSYIRAWIPAIQNLGSQMIWTHVIIDRLQGGFENIKKEGVQPFSVIGIDNHLFDMALKMGIINENQVDMLNNFFVKPDETMKKFLIEHSEFIENALNSDEKTKKRARLLIDGDLYGLNT